MENYNILIDSDKCIGCKKCIKDCPVNNISILDKKAKIISNKCLECGHCVAICPKNAVYMTNYDMKEVKEYDESSFKINSEIFLNSIKFRRSIRSFTNEDIDENIIKNIIESARFTPTGSNKQEIRYVVLKNDIEEFELEAIKVFKRLKKLLKCLSFFIKLPYDVNKFNIESGFFFHGAKIVILSISKNEVDSSLAARSMELMSEYNGLGTLHVGFFKIASRLSNKIRKNLGLTKKEKVVNCIALGYPNVKYERTVPRKKASVIWR